MARIDLTGTTLNVTDLIVGQQYAMALYCRYPGNTSYTQVDRQPEKGTRAAGTTTWTFNISEYVKNTGKYSFYVHIYAPGQSPQNSDTKKVTYPITITGYCGEGVSSFRMSSSGGAYQTVSSSGGQSMTVKPKEQVNFTQLTPLDGYSAPYSLYYNREDQSGWFGPATTFNITDTTFDRQVRITATALPKPVIPIITSVVTTKDSATIYWDKNGAIDGSWTLFYRAGINADISYGNVRSSPVVITGLTPGTTYFFKVRHTLNGTYKDSEYVSAATKNLIGYFSWTTDDENMIAAGQPIRNITASAWTNLISKISACGGNSSSVYSADPGSRITANHFNTMRNSISGLTGAGSVPSSVNPGASKVLASLFIGLKDAINRAISYKNST